MKKQLLAFVLLSYAVVIACDLLGLGEEKTSPQIKDFVWKVDTLQFPNVMFDLNISGEYLNDLWLVNRYYESGFTKFKNNEMYISSTIQAVGNLKYYKGSVYGGGVGSLKKVQLSNKFALESLGPVLTVDRTDLNYKNGTVIDIAVDNNDLYLLCTYENEDLMPSYTTVVKWNGTTSTLVFTSEWGVQGQQLLSGKNGVFFKGFKIEFEGTLVKRVFGAIGTLQTGDSNIFIIAERESDYLSLGKIGDEVYLKYNEELFALKDGKSSSTGLRFPANTFGFSGHGESNILATGISGYFVYDGTTWAQIPLPINTNTGNRIGEPLLLNDGVVSVITQRPLSTTFYLVRGYPQ